MGAIVSELILLPMLFTGYMSAVNARTISSMKNQSYIIDEPILPSLASQRSPGDSMRLARAKSFPAVQYLRSQQIPKLPTTEKESQKETTAATVEPANVVSVVNQCFVDAY